MKNHQKGFVTALVILIIVILALGGIYIYNQNRSSEVKTDLSSTTDSSSETTGPTPISSDDSGITGTVTIGPTCPGPLANNDKCADKPFSTTFDLTTKGGALIKQFKSDTNGIFKIQILPGVYVIKESNPKTYPTLGSVEVSVNPHTYTKVSLQFDSGIR